MARRDRDPRPPIEVFGGGPTEESVQEVAVGGHGRGRRRWSFAIAAVALLIGAGVLLSDGPSEPDSTAASSSTTRSTVRRTTTTSTLPAPIGQVLPEPTGGAALLLTAAGSEWWLLDLDSGALREIDRQFTFEFGGIVPMRGGVAVSNGSDALYLPLLAGGDPVKLGDGGFLAGAGSGDLVWVGSNPEGGGPPEEIRLVDLRGRVRARRPFPSQYYEVTEVGPLVGVGGRAFVIDEDGPRPLGVGDPVGSSARQAVVRECGEDGVCRVLLVDVLTGERREVTSLRGDPSDDYASVQLGPDGDVVQVRFDERTGQPALRWVSADDRLLAEGQLERIGEQGYYGSELAFLPGGQGVAWPLGSEVVGLVRPVDGRLGVREVHVPGLRGIEQVFVVSP